MAKIESKPIYVLYGGDAYLTDRARHEIIAARIGEADPQLCVSSFEADAELPAVLDELRTLPFLAPHRVVVLRAADAFVSAHRKALESYCQQPCETGTLVMQVNSWPKNTKLYKIVAQSGQAIDCAPPKQAASAGKWLSDQAGDLGKRFTRPALQLLCQLAAADLCSLAGEVEKLALYVGDREQITPEDVSAVVTAAGGVGAFDLTNAITDGDTARSLRVLGQMLTARGEEFKTLGLIGWHLRRAMATCQRIHAGTAPNRATPNMPPSQQRGFLRMVERRGMNGLRKDFHRLLEADLRMKSGGRPDAVMRDLVVQLCQ